MMRFVRLETATGQHPDRPCREREVCEEHVVVLVDDEATHRLADTQTGKVVGGQRGQLKSVVAMRSALYTGAFASMRYFIVSAPVMPCSWKVLRMLK